MAMNAKRMRLGDLLVESKIITEQQLMSALNIQKTVGGGKKLGEILVDIGVITEEQKLTTLQKKLNIPMVRLENMTVMENVISQISEDFAKKKGVFPYKLTGNTLYIATSDPLDYDLLNEVSTTIGKNIEPVLASPIDITNAIEKHYYKHSIDSTVSELTTSNEDIGYGSLEEDEFSEMEERIGNVPVVKFINNLVIQAYNKRASDIHIEIYDGNLRIRFRVDGDLITTVSMSGKSHASVVTRLKIMAGMDIAEKRIPLDGRFNMKLGEVEFGVRVNSMPTVFGEKIVLRIMPDSKSGIVSLEGLRIKADHTKAIRSALALHNGLVLVTGPTGSGKSTTLYAMVDEMSEESTNMITIEDPVEKIIPGINQTQINAKAGLTFAIGLRAVLRQDPDKIMIGEIRDGETADIACRAAITGHMVIASIHTNSAASTYMRLTDMGVEPFIIASSVLAVVAQRLVKLICPNCIEAYQPSPEEIEFFKVHKYPVPQKLYRGRGCNKCGLTGSAGRSIVMEVILTDSTVKSMIMDKAKDTDIERYLSENRNQKYILDHAVELAWQGKVDFKDIIGFASVAD